MNDHIGDTNKMVANPPLLPASGSAKPRRKTCTNCDGKKWFDSAIGMVSCQVCGGDGKGGIDVEWLVKDWQRLMELQKLAVRLGNLWNQHIREAKEHGDIGFIREQETVAELRLLLPNAPHELPATKTL